MCSELLSTVHVCWKRCYVHPQHRQGVLHVLQDNKEARVAGVELQREEMLWGLGANQIGKKAEGKFCKAL